MTRTVTDRSRRLEGIATHIEQLVDDADPAKSVEENARELADTYEDYQRLKIALEE